MDPNNDYDYIDIRTTEELEELVSPRGATNIPSHFTEDDCWDDDASWTLCDDFVARTQNSFSKDSKLIIGNKCIIRQMQACDALVEAGFDNVFLHESQDFVQTKGRNEEF
ncbi:unnamed protein product [Heterosigma akashiwo]